MSNIKNDYLRHFPNIFTYLNKNDQKIAAITIWQNGLTLLNEARAVKEFDVFKNISFTELQPPNFEILFPFINDSLIDNIRIITCFENFMKGILIVNDYVVHKLTNKNKLLKNAQRNRPLKIFEVFTQSSFLNFEQTKPELFETYFQTVNFTWMLEPKYQEVINLPVDIISILVNLNAERNKLHFINRNTYRFGIATIENYSRIIDFANTTIKKRILDLENDLKKYS